VVSSLTTVFPSSVASRYDPPLPLGVSDRDGVRTESHLFKLWQIGPSLRGSIFKAVRAKARGQLGRDDQVKCGQ
jgi:hypothetical protein